MPRNMRVSATIVIVFFSTVCYASSPTLGADISLAVVRKLLAGSPLPSLEADGNSIAPMYGYVKTDNGADFVSPEGTHMQFTGGASGNTAGISFTRATKSDVGFYLFGLGNRVHGASDVSQDGIASYSITDVKSEAYAISGGISYRLLGTDESVAAFGLFGGPAYISVKSSSKFDPSDSFGGGSTSDFTFNPTYYGIMSGFQLSVRFSIFRINPYVLIFNDASESCKKITSSDNDASSAIITCGGKTSQVPSSASFPAYGVNLGVGPFRVNVVAEIPGEFMKVTSYTGSIGITF